MIRAALIAGAALAIASPALADPCKAPVTGYAPGATVAGEVRYIGDGDSLCIGPGRDPDTWVEIRLADFYAPELHDQGGREAKRTLERLTRGRRMVCTAEHGAGHRTYSFDRLIARCAVDGRDLGDMMRGAGVREGGRGR